MDGIMAPSTSKSKHLIVFLNKFNCSPSCYMIGILGNKTMLFYLVYFVRLNVGVRHRNHFRGQGGHMILNIVEHY